MPKKTEEQYTIGVDMVGLIKALAEPIEGIKFRAQSSNAYGSIVVAYVDSRQVQQHLDNVCSKFNTYWSNGYERKAGDLFGYIDIWDGQQWVRREDMGEESSQAKKKGEASDAFKRAAILWGVGRSIYSIGEQKLPSCPDMQYNPQTKSYDKQKTDDKGKPKFLPSVIKGDFNTALKDKKEITEYMHMLLSLGEEAARSQWLERIEELKRVRIGNYQAKKQSAAPPAQPKQNDQPSRASYEAARKHLLAAKFGENAVLEFEAKLAPKGIDQAANNALDTMVTMYQNVRLAHLYLGWAKKAAVFDGDTVKQVADELAAAGLSEITTELSSKNPVYKMTEEQSEQLKQAITKLSSIK